MPTKKKTAVAGPRPIRRRDSQRHRRTTTALVNKVESEVLTAEAIQFLNRLAHEFEPVSASEMASTVDLKPLIDEVAAVAALESQCWSTDVRGMLVTQLESYHRLAILIGDLDAEISNLAASEKGEAVL